MRTILDYLLERPIGGGDGTVVFRARRLPGDQTFAIKVASPDLSEPDLFRIEGRIRGEAEILSRLARPGVVPLVELIDGGLDPGAGPGPVAIVYPLAEDGTLEDLAALTGQLEDADLARWHATVRQALTAAHDLGIQHGHICARSLLVSGNEIWLSGFGSTVAEASGAEADLARLDDIFAALRCGSDPAPGPGPDVGSAPQRAGLHSSREAPRGDPPARSAQRPRPPRRWDRFDRRRQVLAASLVAATVCWVVIALALSPGGRHRAPMTEPVTSTSVATTGAGARPVQHQARPTKQPCPGSVPAVPAGATAVPGDPTGVGCTIAVVWWPGRGEAERPEASGAMARFALGDPGDQLILGDWDGDGRDTPAIYDPVRGALIRFDGWAEPGRTLAGRLDPVAAPVGGLAGVVRRSGGDGIEIQPAP